MSNDRALTFGEYQEAAAKTAAYPRYPSRDALSYLVAGLASEAGEVAGVWKKHLRDGTGYKDGLRAELGDVLWYVAMLATELGVDLGDVASGNMAKLASRQERGVIGGSGDNR